MLIVSRAKPNIGPGAFLADALRDFLLQVGATKPILVGHSIGGMIVQQLLSKSLMSSLRRSLIQIWATS
jgi:pimeloyl-ACP methyl ester carboxylesterase